MRLLIELYLEQKAPAQYPRILTDREQQQMMRLLLEKKELRQLILDLEQVNPATVPEAVITEAKQQRICQSYPFKLRKLFYGYNILCNYSNKQSKCSAVLKRLYSEYHKLLKSKNCIDSFSLLALLEETPCALDYELLCLFPQQLDCEDLATLQFLSSRNVVQVQCLTGLEEQKDPNSKASDFPLATCTIEDWLSHQKKDYGPISISDTAIKKFPSAHQELNYACSTIRQLLKTVAAHDIAITICNETPQLLQDLHSIARRYALPLDLPGQKPFPLLKHFKQLRTDNFKVSTLQALLMNPDIDWKNRRKHIKIIQTGVESVNADAENLEQWYRVLSRLDHSRKKRENTTEDNSDVNSDLLLCEYFFELRNSILKILRARSFLQLRNLLDHFIETYIYCNKKTQKTWINDLFDYIDDCILFSKHCAPANSAETGKSFEETAKINPFQTVEGALKNYTLKVPLNESTIQVYPFPHALHTCFEHHFFINFSQNNLSLVLDKPNFFHEMLSVSYVSPALLKQYENRNNYLLCSIEQSAAHASISFSEQTYEGAQTVPVFWTNIKNESPPEDNWKREESFWYQLLTEDSSKKEPTPFPVSEEQEAGMKFQKDLAKISTPKSLFLHPAPEQIKKKFQRAISVPQTDSNALPRYRPLNNSLSPSSLYTALQDPLAYALSRIFNLDELFPVNDFVYSSSASFSSAIHDLFAHISTVLASLIEEKLEKQTLDNEQDLRIILKNIKPLLPEFSEHVNKHFTTMNAHYFMRRSMQEAFEEVVLCQFVSTIIFALVAQGLSIKQVEQRLTIDLSTLQHNGNYYPPFILRGIPDLSFYDARLDCFRFFDYKLHYDTDSETLEKHFTQLWAYSALSNANPNLLRPYASENADIPAEGEAQNLQEKFDLLGSIYYLDESTSDLKFKKMLFPSLPAFEQEPAANLLEIIREELSTFFPQWKQGFHCDQVSGIPYHHNFLRALEKRTERIYQFLTQVPELLRNSLYKIFHLDFTDELSENIIADLEPYEDDSTDQDSKAPDSQKKKPDRNFIMKSIVRDECYMYRNRS